MKRYVIVIVSLVVLFVVAWPLLAQPEGGRGGGRGEGRRGGRGGFMGGQRQTQAIEAIEGELTKMKKAFESFSFNRESFQNLSEEERTALREKFRKIRQERRDSITVIEEQLARLKGPRGLRTAHEESIEKLNGLLELAKKENAEKTAQGIEKLIAEKKKVYEAKLKKLGFEGMERRGGRGRREGREGRGGREGRERRGDN